MSRNISGQIADRFGGCQQTALHDDFLAEIGRITVHYGLFVAQARKLVQELSANDLVDWDLCTREDLIRNLLVVLKALETRCSDEYSEWLTQAIQQVHTAKSVMDRVRLSIWGMNSSAGEAIATSTPLSKIDCQPSILDVHRHTRNDLYTLAMEVTLATRYLAYIQQEISALYL